MRHITLLAEVGENSESSLPWIERDYTPISSAKDWENGKCDLLIKIYHDGLATSWLCDAQPPKVWLSKPVRTLHVPSLCPWESSFSPSSGGYFLPIFVKKAKRKMIQFGLIPFLRA